MPDVIVIDDNLRTMTIPPSITLLGVESDDDVNKIPFQMPKEYCGFDLSTFQARINYMNANGDGDIYIVDDLAVDGNDPSMMTFTWLVGRNACAYKGNTKFIVCLKMFDEDSTVIQEFNTTVYSLPVLQGLETVEAVQQQNADIIEYILNLLDESGVIDPANYYTKSEVDALIPTELPNPAALTLNGVSYDGSEAVDMTISVGGEVLSSASGKIIHVTDAVPNEAVESLELYDSSDAQIASAAIAIANKNLFRLDQIASQVTSKGITFTKNADGSVTAAGTSTGTYPSTQCNLDKNIFVVGKTYTLSSGKTSGYLYVQLIINYTDNTTDYIVARNSARTFTIEKAVASVVGSIQITDSGVTLNETIYAQLELNNTASAFVNNSYTSLVFNGSVLPVLPAYICNIWSNDDTVANIELEYEADVVEGKINAFAVDSDTGIEAEVGDLDDLTTTDKSSIVAAINELVTRLNS